MDVPYLHTGRTNQKARTRDALIAAARQLLAEGVTPTIEAAAAEAAIGRTTAYRYFPNSRALLAATYQEIEMDSLLGADPPEDALARLGTSPSCAPSCGSRSRANLRAATVCRCGEDEGSDGSRKPSLL